VTHIGLAETAAGSPGGNANLFPHEVEFRVKQASVTGCSLNMARVDLDKVGNCARLIDQDSQVPAL